MVYFGRFFLLCVKSLFGIAFTRSPIVFFSVYFKMLLMNVFLIEINIAPSNTKGRGANIRSQSLIGNRLAGLTHFGDVLQDLSLSSTLLLNLVRLKISTKLGIVGMVCLITFATFIFFFSMLMNAFYN